MKNLRLCGMTAMSVILAACGGNGSSSSSTTSQQPVNSAPVASAVSETLLQNAMDVSITLSATDADGDTLSYSLGTQPMSGTVMISGNVVTYTPNTDFSGEDSFTFTASDGEDQSNEATVTLTIQPTSGFAGKLILADGSPVTNVAVQALDANGETITTTLSDVDGKFTLTAVTEQELVLNFLSEDHANQVLPVTMSAQKSALLPLGVTLIERGAAQTLDSDAGGMVSGAGGANVTLSAGSFVDETGAAVTGNITAQITPVDVSNPQSLAAFPGDFTGVDDMNNAETAIVSLGTVEYVFTQNGMPLQLGNGATADIQLPLYQTTHPVTGDTIVMGDEIELWSLNEDTGIWDQEGTGTVVANADSPTGLALLATVTHFTWWNIDVPIPTADVDITLSGNVTGGVAIIHARAPSDFGGFRTATRNIIVGATSSGIQIPADRETCFWIEYVDPSGATALSDEQCITNAIPDSTNPLTFNVITAGSLSLRAPYLRSSYFVDTPLAINIAPLSLETSVSYALTSGSLPAGLSLSSTSATNTQIIGSTSAIGTYALTLEGTDSDGFTDSESFTLSIIDTPAPSLRSTPTLYANIGDAISQTISVFNNGGDAPTSWIVTQADGSAVPAGVGISSDGVFSVASYDGVAASYLVTAYNIKGASNMVTIDLLDIATSPPVLPTGYGWTHVSASPTTVDLGRVNTGAPATSWTLTNTDGTPATDASISAAGVVTYPDLGEGSSVNYTVTAYNGTLQSGDMNLNIYFEMEDPCLIDPSVCGGGF